ncbi:unnamed protein product [Allacma fusca]|nr:unnamed protein product [Allacma fusca]
MVSIKFKEGQHFCGGFVINRNFILSAAHCFDSITEKFSKLSMMKAVVGEHHHLKKEEPVDAIDINFAKIIRHGQYDQFNLSHDIALLKLETALEWTPFVQPLCLPDSTEETKISYGTIAGWGRTGEREPASDVLLQATVPILDNSKCQQFFNLAQFKFLVNTFQFCAGRFFGGVDTCLGDSGGPLMIREKISSTEQMTALGIVSLGKGCGRVALPGIYTKIASYIPWIKDQVLSQ